MDTLPLIVLGFAGYTVFVLLFLRFVSMLRHKDDVMLHQE